MKRPWKIEYEGAEGETHVLRSYHYELVARLALPRLEREHPGLGLTLRKHVEFDAKH